jgi:TetR/AcrR family transcriptional regulator, lmrAB and yxaGH operons repressor
MTESTRQRMLTATARLLQERGYRGTSLKDILAESGAPRGSLYYHFPGGKEELAREATRIEVQYVSEYVKAAFEESSGPAQAVGAYIRGAREHARGSKYRLGCPVASLVLDSPEASSAIGELCRRALEEWRALIRDGLVAGGIPAARADSLSTLILTSVEGALIVARSQRDPEPLDTIAGELVAAVAAEERKAAAVKEREGRPAGL